MSQSPVTHAREFTVSGPKAAYSARRAVEEGAQGWLDPALLAGARLLVSEVVTAVAVQHGGPADIAVRLLPKGAGGIRAEIVIPIDERPPVRAFRLVAGHRAQILDALADGWGLVREPGAPYVWFELGVT
jgi:hypothetical protein